MVEQNSHFRTSDTAQAAFLIVKRHRLDSIDYGPVRYEFVFLWGEDIQKDANDYLVGSALFDPSHYSRIYRKLNRILRKHCQWEED